jgi:cytoskeletal protein RodZ
MADDYTQTPGRMLRQAREQRGLSLATCEEGTKIPIRLIEAIERDEYHKLSGPLYVKSFLRNYAGFLGVDVGAVLRTYELATGRPEATPTAAAADEVWSEDQVSVTRVGMAWGRLVAIAVAAVVVLVLLFVVALRVFGGGDDPAPVPATSAAPEQPVQEQTTVAGSLPRPDDPAPTTTAERPPPSTATSRSQPEVREETAAQRRDRLDRHTFAVMDEGLATEPSADDERPARPSPVVSPATLALEPPRRGDADLRFAGGQTYPLVLRVVLPEPANCSVRRDDLGSSSVPVIWPDRPAPPPAYNLQHGLAYAVRGGYAIYWGADDHFTLTLERVAGAEVTLNGTPLSLSGWRAGQTKLLDASWLPSGG